MDSSHACHSREDLERIAADRRPGSTLANVAHIWCSECGAPWSLMGLFHWPQCLGEDKAIRFRSR